MKDYLLFLILILTLKSKAQESDEKETNNEDTTRNPNKPIVYKDLRLFNHYKGDQADLPEECWVKCLDESDCVAITFAPSTWPTRCFLYKENLGFQKENGFISYSKKQLIDLSAKKFTYKDLRLSNHYKQMRAKNSNECWRNCLEESDCVATTFSPLSYGWESRCFLYKKGFGTEKETGFVGNSREEIADLEKIPFIYKNLELKDHFKIIFTDSPSSCWTKCLDEPRCNAITFPPLGSGSSKPCFWFKKTLKRQKNEGYVTYSKDKINIK